MSKRKDAPPIEVFSELLNLAADQRQSLSEFAATARLAPVVLMEDAVLRLEPEVIHSINQVHLSLYSAFYLSVLGLQQQGKGGITAEQVIEPLSDRRKVDTIGILNDLAFESEEAMIPGFMKAGGSLLDDIAMEGRGEASEMEIAKPTSLAVGKVLNVPLGEGFGGSSMTVSVVLNPRVVDKSFLMRVLEAYIAKDNSIIGRWHRWRAGEIKSFSDWAFCLDMIREDKQLLLDDTDGLLENARSKSLLGKLTEFITGKKSMNVASNFVLMTKQGAAELERTMRGRLKDFRKREKFFETTGTMILTVVDPSREVVTMYTRGFQEVGMYSYDDLAPAASNANHVDINAVMKAYKEGAAFSL